MESFKIFRLPSKKRSISNKYLKISFDDKTNANSFKEFYCNLASDLVAKLPPPSNRFGTTSAHKYYEDVLNLLPCKFKFSFVTEDLVLKLLKDMNIDKAAVIDNF